MCKCSRTILFQNKFVLSSPVNSHQGYFILAFLSVEDTSVTSGTKIEVSTGTVYKAQLRLRAMVRIRTRVRPFRLKFVSLISEIKRIWIRFTCVSLFHYKISLLFFRFFALIFASNFSLRFPLVIFASKRNKDNLEEGYKNAYHGSKNPEIRTQIHYK